MRKLIAVLCFLLPAAIGLAQRGYVRLAMFPEYAVADSRTPVTVNAEVRDRNGKYVPDGTQVKFDSTMGTFKEPIVEAINGFARATFIPGNEPGTAKITVSVLSLSTTSTVELEILQDASMMSQANQYIEVVGPSYLMYSMEPKVLAASGENKGVQIRYRDIEVWADDIQLKVPFYELKARKARLKFGKVEQEFEELYLKLDTRRGYGITTFEADVEVGVIPAGRMVYPIFEKRRRFGVVEVRGTGLEPYTQPVPDAHFKFDDLSEFTTTSISSKKAVVFPNKEIQFHRAEVMVGNAKVIKLPLFSVNLQPGAPSTLADQILTINDNQVGINYPYYLSLKPGETSLFRVRTGERYGRSLTGAGGTFLDYELKWNKGDHMNGGLTVSGLARPDWSVDLTQSYRFKDGSTVYANLSSPAHRSLYGSVHYNKHFEGFNLGVTGSTTRSLKGSRYDTEVMSVSVEKDATKVGNLPLRLYYGVTASHDSIRSDFLNRSQDVYGLRMRGQFLTLPIDQVTTLNGSFTLSQLYGRNAPQDLAIVGNATLARRFGDSATLVLSYDYYDDEFNSEFFGKHRLTAQGYYSAGRTDLNFVVGKSLNVDRLNIVGDMSYRMSSLWRLSYSYTLDQYLGDKILDYDAMISYRIGWREVGLTWSNRTKRFGIQLLGTTFD